MYVNEPRLHLPLPSRSVSLTVGRNALGGRVETVAQTVQPRLRAPISHDIPSSNH